jgi:hypothetical protein
MLVVTVPAKCHKRRLGAESLAKDPRLLRFNSRDAAPKNVRTRWLGDAAKRWITSNWWPWQSGD